MKKCPFCAEEIQDAAIKCKHCGSALASQGSGGAPVVVAVAALLVAAVVALAAMVLTRRGPATAKPAPGASPARTVEASPAAPEAAPSPVTTAPAPAAPQLQPAAASPAPPAPAASRTAELTDASRQAEIGKAVVRLENGNLKAVGSGFLVSADGYVLTARHVVDQASAVDVEMSDGSKETAAVVGTDEKGDVALLRLDGRTDRPFLPLGDATSVTTSRPVMAVGYPLGLKNCSFTSGIVSAAPAYLDTIPFALIQIDAAINPGNSGGPLLDADGRVVGIISGKLRGAEAMNFASPVNYVASLPLPAASTLKSEAFDRWTAAAEEKHFAASTAPGAGEPQEVSIENVTLEADAAVVQIGFLDGGTFRAYRGGVTVTMEYSTVVAGKGLVEGIPCESHVRFSERDFADEARGPVLEVRVECPKMRDGFVQSARVSAVTDGGRHAPDVRLTRR